MPLIAAKAIIIGTLLCLLSSVADAVEIYALLKENCRLHFGLIINAEGDRIDLVNLSGESETLSRQKVKSLVVYNLPENPFANLRLTGLAQEHLRDIYVDSGPTPYLTGWPVKFVEDLVIFFDINGNTFVLDFDRMTRIRRPRNIAAQKSLRSVTPAFDLSDVVGNCPKLSQGPAGTIPTRATRVINDQIQLSEFLSNFSDGYERMDSFEERTYLYAIPYLYEKNTRLAFHFLGQNFEQPKTTAGFHFQWSKGGPYRFQSFNQIGYFPMRYAPSTEPFFGGVTELKSHIFHAAFMGNLSALSAGTPYYTNVQTFFDRDTKDPGERSHFAPGFNYMALMGGDWLAWSFSVGTYFPSFAFIADNTFREVLASKIQPIGRIMYTRPNWQVMVLLSAGNYGKNSGVSDDDISIDTNNSVVGVIQSFALKYQFIRSDFTYKWTKDLSTSLQFVQVNGTYSETTTLNADNSFDFNHQTLVVGIRRQFGDYVALSAEAKNLIQKQHFFFSGLDHEEDMNKIVYGGTFEFIF